MANSREPFAWPELTLYVWGVGDSAAMSWAESVELDVDDAYRKFLYMTTGVGFQTRTQHLRTDRNVTLRIGRLFAGEFLLNIMNSAVNLSAVTHFAALAPAEQVESEFVLYSARVTHFQAVGRHAEIWRENVTIIAPGINTG
jgi:hypothetical protein